MTNSKSLYLAAVVIIAPHSNLPTALTLAAILLIAAIFTKD